MDSLIHTGQAYYVSWGIYLLAVLGAHILLWRILRVVSNRDVINVLHLMLAAILLTPAALEPGSGYWVPAFMAALMDGLNEGMEAALPRLWLILTTMLILVSAGLLAKLYARRLRLRQVAATSGAADQ